MSVWHLRDAQGASRRDLGVASDHVRGGATLRALGRVRDRRSSVPAAAQLVLPGVGHRRAEDDVARRLGVRAPAEDVRKIRDRASVAVVRPRFTITRDVSSRALRMAPE